MNRALGIWDSCVEAARQAYEKGCYAEADQILSTTMEKFNSNTYQLDMQFVNLLITYARVKRERDQFSDALSFFYRALSILRMKVKDEKALIGKILQEIALCLCLSGRFQQAREKEKRALIIFDEIFGFDSKIVDESVIRLACLSWILEDLDSASVYLERHLKYCARLEELTGQEMVAPTTMLAQAHYRIGNNEIAERLFKKSREIFQEQDKLARELSIIDNELGLAICAQGRCKEARSYCQEAAALRKKCESRGEKVAKSKALNDIADSYCERDDFDSAKPLCLSAESSRWDAPDGDIADKLMLYSRLIERLGQSTEVDRIVRRARELAHTA